MNRQDGVRVHRGSWQHWSRMALATGMAAISITVASAPADAKEAESVTRDVEGSWYQPNPTCASVLGCQELPLPSAYPAGTVHVGVLAGVEESRTFVAIDLPQGKELESGMLTMPVSAEFSRVPEGARLQACLATGVFDPADQGSTSTSPTPLCDFSSPVKVGVPDDPQAALNVTMTVDLAPFLTTWATESKGLLAIVPVADVTVTDAWHVAFSTSARAADTGEFTPMSAKFVVASRETQPDPGDDDVTPPVDNTGSDGFTSGPVSSGTFTPPAAPPISNAPEMGPPPAPVAADPTAPVVSAAPMQLVGYRYPGVYVVPLIFALGLVWATRAFTADLTKAWR